MFIRAVLSFVIFFIYSQTMAASIDWEIANRYRFFKDESQFRAIAQAYSELSDSERRDHPALSLEIALERKAILKQLGNPFGDRASVAHYGWASAVVGQDKNCFVAGNRNYASCTLANGDAYLEPKSFDALANLTDSAALQGRLCQWSVNGKPAGEAPCNEPIRLPKIAFGEEFSLSVASDGLGVASLSNQIGRVVTIVGMGDSFASGEGNPDKPVFFGNAVNLFNRSSHLDENAPPTPVESDSAFRLYPLRLGVHLSGDGDPIDYGRKAAAAKWLMEQCHRSLYSQQVKATLALALEQRQLAVTFLGYACTGATVNAGLLGYWQGRGDPKYTPHQFYDASPQLMKYLRDACRTQKGYNIYSEPARFNWRNLPPCRDPRLKNVDALLVSIGGNDVDFANVIVHESVDSGGRFEPFLAALYPLWREVADPASFNDARTLARDKLPQYYRELAEALHQYVPVESHNILLTAYPQMTKLADGKFCNVQNAIDGMQVHEILGLRRNTTGKEAADFVTDLTGFIKAAVPSNQGWQVVDNHVEQFAGHAICPGQGSTDPWQFPTLSDDGTEWLHGDPRIWATYRLRDRWFVTPNDAFLATDYMMPDRSRTTDRTQPMFAATLSGAFHPNALGHAAIADAVLPRLRETLGLRQP
jgi:hypothetical protein